MNLKVAMARTTIKICIADLRDLDEQTYQRHEALAPDPVPIGSCKESVLEYSARYGQISCDFREPSVRPNSQRFRSEQRERSLHEWSVAAETLGMATCMESRYSKSVDCRSYTSLTSC